MTAQRYIAHGLVEVRGRYLFMQRRMGGYLGGYWDIPGGTVEPGERLEAAAVRECAEEAGLATRAGGQLSYFENMDIHGDDVSFHTVTYRLHPATSDPQVRLSNEHQAFVWATHEETNALDLVWHVKRTLDRLA